MGIGLLIIKACELRAAGLDIEKNAEKLNEIKHTIHQMGTLDDLFWVASKGRISHAKAFMGMLVGIKPMGDFNSDGLVTVLGKAKGYDKAYSATIEYIKRTGADLENQIIIVSHSGEREKQAKALAQLIEENIKPKEIIFSDVYPSCGINVGPGLCAAFYTGTPITDLKSETGILKAILER